MEYPYDVLFCSVPSGCERAQLLHITLALFRTHQQPNTTTSTIPPFVAHA